MEDILPMPHSGDLVYDSSPGNYSEIIVFSRCGLRRALYTTPKEAKK